MFQIVSTHTLAKCNAFHALRTRYDPSLQSAVTRGMKKVVEYNCENLLKWEETQHLIEEISKEKDNLAKIRLRLLDPSSSQLSSEEEREQTEG